MEQDWPNANIYTTLTSSPSNEQVLVFAIKANCKLIDGRRNVFDPGVIRVLKLFIMIITEQWTWLFVVCNTDGLVIETTGKELILKHILF